MLPKVCELKEKHLPYVREGDKNEEGEQNDEGEESKLVVQPERAELY